MPHWLINRHKEKNKSTVPHFLLRFSFRVSFLTLILPPFIIFPFHLFFLMISYCHLIWLKSILLIWSLFWIDVLLFFSFNCILYFVLVIARWRKRNKVRLILRVQSSIGLKGNAVLFSTFYAPFWLCIDILSSIPYSRWDKWTWPFDTRWWYPRLLETAAFKRGQQSIWNIVLTPNCLCCRWFQTSRGHTTCARRLKKRKEKKNRRRRICLEADTQVWNNELKMNKETVVHDFRWNTGSHFKDSRRSTRWIFLTIQFEILTDLNFLVWRYMKSPVYTVLSAQ